MTASSTQQMFITFPVWSDLIMQSFSNALKFFVPTFLKPKQVGVASGKSMNVGNNFQQRALHLGPASDDEQVLARLKLRGISEMHHEQARRVRIAKQLENALPLVPTHVPDLARALAIRKVANVNQKSTGVVQPSLNRPPRMMMISQPSSTFQTSGTQKSAPSKARILNGIELVEKKIARLNKRIDYLKKAKERTSDPVRQLQIVERLAREQSALHQKQRLKIGLSKLATKTTY